MGTRRTSWRSCRAIDVAIYRPPQARWPLALAAGIGGLLIGMVAGLVLGSDDPDPNETASAIRATLAAAAGSLEVAQIEYREAVSDGGVERRTEYEGSLDALDSSRSNYRTVRPALETLVPSLVQEVDDLYQRCTSLMKAPSDVPDVSACLVRLGELLKGTAERP